MATGRVLQFDQGRGYGFVAADDGGEDVFLHASVFDGDADVLAPGMKVEFKVMAGDRGRKAFAAHLVADEFDSEEKPIPAVSATPPVIPAQAGPGQVHAEEEPPDEEQMCDVLSQGEFQQQLTELLLTNVPTLTGQQILGVRQSLLECARKHGWVDT